MTRIAPSLAHEFEAALAWWQMAGVDHDFTDDATVWLAEPPAQAGPAASKSGGVAGTNAAGATHAAIGVDERPITPQPHPSPTQAVPRRNLLGDSPPADLASFQRWWMEAPELDTARGFARVAPRGKTGAALMVLVPQPEAEDRERLLSGPQGRLLANILAAIGIGEDDAYIASALPSHAPMADLAGLAAGGLDAVTAHHIGLVRPARLLAFGNGLAPMLGGLAEHPLREINHAGGKVPVLSSETLDALMDMPRLKARFWRRWIEWSATH